MAFPDPFNIPFPSGLPNFNPLGGGGGISSFGPPVPPFLPPNPFGLGGFGGGGGAGPFPPLGGNGSGSSGPSKFVMIIGLLILGPFLFILFIFLAILLFRWAKGSNSKNISNEK